MTEYPEGSFESIKKVKVELTLAQLDDLLSNKISKMIPVIEYIRKNVEEAI